MAALGIARQPHLNGPAGSPMQVVLSGCPVRCLSTPS